MKYVQKIKKTKKNETVHGVRCPPSRGEMNHHIPSMSWISRSSSSAVFLDPVIGLIILSVGLVGEVTLTTVTDDRIEDDECLCNDELRDDS